MVAAALGLILCGVAPGRARAGRRPFLVAQDATLVPDGDVELELWLDYLDLGATAPDKWRFWIGPRWAPIEGLELAGLTVLQQVEVEGQPSGGGTLWAEILEARWRALPIGERGALILQLDYRIAIQQLVLHEVAPMIGVAGRYGRFEATAQVGHAYGFREDLPSSQALPYRGGVAVDLIHGEIAPPLQLGAEIEGEQMFDGKNDFDGTRRSHANVGPTLSCAKGRLWLTGGVLWPLHDNPNPFVRAVIGLAL
jgi:hypothetical protein